MATILTFFFKQFNSSDQGPLGLIETTFELLRTTDIEFERK